VVRRDHPPDSHARPSAHSGRGRKEDVAVRCVTASTTCSAIHTHRHLTPL
jgi:hypothetical protein